MILLNFSHPLTPEQKLQIENLVRQPLDEVFNLDVQFDTDSDFLPQLEALFKEIPLSAADFQTKPILVNPPALNFIAVLAQAELHGRMGYFAPIVRLKPVTNTLPPLYEVAEILNLQAVRDRARKQRF